MGAPADLQKKFRAREKNFAAGPVPVTVASARKSAHAQLVGGVPVAAAMIDGSLRKAAKD
jgi:hypothetical protein